MTTTTNHSTRGILRVIVEWRDGRTQRLAAWPPKEDVRRALDECADVLFYAIYPRGDEPGSGDEIDRLWAERRAAQAAAQQETETITSEVPA